MEFGGSDRKKVLWEVVDDPVIEEVNNRDEIGLQGFYFNFFDEDKEWVSREGLSDYPCLSILMEIWPGYWKNYLKKMYIAVY